MPKVKPRTLGRRGTCERDMYQLRSALEALALVSRRHQSRRTGVVMLPLRLDKSKQRLRPKHRSSKPARKLTAKKTGKRVARRKRLTGGGDCASCGSCPYAQQQQRRV